MSAEPLEVEAESWGAVAAIVLRNWRDELVALAQDIRSGAWRAPSDVLSLVVSAEEVVTVLRSAGREQDLGRFACSAAGADALAARLEQTGAAGNDVELHFDEAAMLRARVRLPKTSPGALRGALSFELERLSPLPPAQLYYDYLLEQPAANRVELVSRALRRRTVDDALTFARMSGLAVNAIRLGSDRKLADWRRFPLDRGALLRGLWRLWGSVALAGLAAVLVLGIVLAVAARGAAQDELIEISVAGEEVRAALVGRLVHKAQDLRRQAAFVADRKARPSFVGTLAALTDALPDNTWLAQIQLDAGKLHVQGFSRTAADLIARLDRSGHFRNAQFKAPLVRNDVDGSERFDLTADVVGAR